MSLSIFSHASLRRRSSPPLEIRSFQSRVTLGPDRLSPTRYRRMQTSRYPPQTRRRSTFYVKRRRGRPSFASSCRTVTQLARSQAREGRRRVGSTDATSSMQRDASREITGILLCRRNLSSVRSSSCAHCRASSVRTAHRWYLIGLTRSRYTYQTASLTKSADLLLPDRWDITFHPRRRLELALRRIEASPSSIVR